MKEVVNIRNLEQAKVLMNPIRIHILNLLATEKTCSELSKQLQLKPQRVNAHLKELLKAKIIKISQVRTIKNLIEAVYIAHAKAYWFSPEVLKGSTKDEKFRDKLSLNNLLLVTEDIQNEVGSLLESAEEQQVPSIGISSEIILENDEVRNAFSKDLVVALEAVFKKYRKPIKEVNKDHVFAAHILCYPKTIQEEM